MLFPLSSKQKLRNLYVESARKSSITREHLESTELHARFYVFAFQLKAKTFGKKSKCGIFKKVFKNKGAPNCMLDSKLPSKNVSEMDVKAFSKLLKYAAQKRMNNFSHVLGDEN